MLFLPDVAAKILFYFLPPYAVGIQTRVSRVAPNQRDLALPTDLPHRGKDCKLADKCELHQLPDLH